MRLFYAVAADEEVKAAAAAVVSRLRRAPGDYRWVDPRDMHVTFRYLGETPESALPGVRERMRRAADRSRPFEIVYGGVGAFESLEDPRVVWIGLQEGVETMESVAKLLERNDPRPFSPHLTLGRRRRDGLREDFVAALKAEPAWGLRRLVEKISLYASRPAPFGHAYEILAEEPLIGA